MAATGADWAGVAVQLVLGLASLALMAWMMISLVSFMRTLVAHMTPGNPILNRYPRGVRGKLGSLFCNHRAPYAKVRDGYGKHYTACSKCGKDLNQGKNQEEWV